MIIIVWISYVKLVLCIGFLFLFVDFLVWMWKCFVCFVIMNECVSDDFLLKLDIDFDVLVDIMMWVILVGLIL